jgi:hypothetical protein
MQIILYGNRGHLCSTNISCFVFYVSVGSHDGFFNGKRYFYCDKEHGVFVPLQDISCKASKKIIGAISRKVRSLVTLLINLCVHRTSTFIIICVLLILIILKQEINGLNIEGFCYGYLST